MVPFMTLGITVIIQLVPVRNFLITDQSLGSIGFTFLKAALLIFFKARLTRFKYSTDIFLIYKLTMCV